MSAIATTVKQHLVIATIREAGRANTRRIAGALDMRSQDVGRICAELKRRGLLRYATDGGRSGYEEIRP